MRHHVDPDLARHVGLTSTGHAGVDEVARAVLAEAILAQREGRATSYSRNRNCYTNAARYGGRHFTFRNVIGAVDHVADLGLVRLTKGFWHPDGTGRQSTFSATPQLAAVGDTVRRILFRKGESVILKDAHRDLMLYQDTRQTITMRRDLRDWTEAVQGSEVRLDAPDVAWVEDGPVSIPHSTAGGGPITINTGAFSFRRVFNNGSWNQGGRTYDHWSQLLPAARRAQIAIDGAPVALLDYSAAHPRMLYARAGLVLDGDPYTVPGVEREIAKVALLIVLNAISRRQGVEAMAGKLAGEGQPRTDAHSKAARDLLIALETHHAPISAQFYRGTGLACQRIEADILNDVAKQARRAGIVTLPVHDELITAAKHESRIRELMIACWTQRVGTDPVVK
ncbi:hypothetical protein U8607_02530 [Methylobacterium durans]|uniref:hypothetical protein n=1 Tax=Methylobacterium durans TaxID=2202825 RepID=UPI002AFE8A35|nr:hypothetical protein [Methylobacterium durans]MEA1830947.1 hypothetical protein [Methylobacterium durans]